MILFQPPDTGERSLSKAAPSLQSSRRNLRRSELSRMNLPLSSPAQASSSSLLNPDALTTKRDTRSASPKTMARNASAFASLGATFARTPDQAEIPNFRSLQTSQSRLPASRSSPTPLNANATTSQGHLTFDIKEQPGLPFPSMGSLTPATPITRTAKPSDDHIRITATQRKPVTWTWYFFEFWHLYFSFFTNNSLTVSCSFFLFLCFQLFLFVMYCIVFFIWQVRFKSILTWLRTALMSISRCFPSCFPLNYCVSKCVGQTKWKRPLCHCVSLKLKYSLFGVFVLFFKLLVKFFNLVN